MKFLEKIPSFTKNLSSSPIYFQFLRFIYLFDLNHLQFRSKKVKTKIKLKYKIKKKYQLTLFNFNEKL